MDLKSFKTRSRIFGHNIMRALRFVWDSGPRWTMASVALLFMEAALPLVGLYLIKLVVDGVVTGLKSSNPIASFEYVALLLVMSGAVAWLVALFRLGSDVVNRTQSRLVGDHMSAILHDKSVEVDLEYYENPVYHDTLYRAQRAARSRPKAILKALNGVGQNSVSLIAIVGLLFWIHWAIIPLLLISGLPAIFVRLYHTTKVHSWERSNTELQRQASYLSSVLTEHTHAQEIRMFDLGSLFKSQFNKLTKEIRLANLKLLIRRAVAEMIAETGATLPVFGVFIYVAYLALHGIITVGDVVMYFGAVQRGAGFLRGLGMSLTTLYEHNLFLTNLYEFLEVKQVVRNPSCPIPMPRPLQKGIVFDNVRFTYPNGTRDVLTEANLTIKPGEHVALVGSNGAGKTSLVKLLCRLYDPSAGRITIDGIDLRNFEISALRKEISVVLQDFVAYDMSVRENIWLGDIYQPLDPNRVEEAAQLAGIDATIGLLPQGYDTMLGKLFDGGEKLSGGEWQKMALARAFFRDSQILIMDEPTSAMDPKAETDLFQRFHELAKGRTAIFISHRLSTVKMADRIFVLDHGRVVEAGTHSELVKNAGMYAELFELQAQHYR